MEMRNVTVEDEHPTALKYSPPDCGGSGWKVEGGKGSEGSYRWCAGSSSTFQPSVSFSFTGTAVYYATPCFEGGPLRFILDGAVVDGIALPRPCRQTSTSSQSAISWFLTGLENREHTLQVLPDMGNRKLAVDTFIYTTTEPEGQSPEMINPPYQHVLDRRAETATKHLSQIPKILGITFGSIVFLIFLFVSWLLHRKAKERKMQYTWKAPVPPLSNSLGGDNHETGHTSFSKGEGGSESRGTAASNYAAASSMTMGSRQQQPYNPQLIPTLEEPERSYDGHYPPSTHVRSNTSRYTRGSESHEQFEEVRISSPTIPHRAPPQYYGGSPEPAYSNNSLLRPVPTQRVASPPAAYMTPSSHTPSYIAPYPRVEPNRRSPALGY